MTSQINENSADAQQNHITQKDINNFNERFHNASMAVQAERFRRHDKALFKKRFSTGFKSLDEALDGGFTEGLHALGAVTSLGKSTFCLQMAEYIASHGTPVIYYSFEMDRSDLTAKQISSQLYLDHPKGSASFALIKDKNSSFLTSESHMSKISSDERAAIDSASEKVQNATGHLDIIQRGSNQICVDDIEKDVRCFCAVRDQKPFVVIDYLSIIGRPDRLLNSPDKQVCDYNLSHLRILADSLHIPILIISSFNRAGYDVPVSKSSFKDSGNIEYTCDVLLGLQLKGVGEEDFDVNEALATCPREEEIVILKQRYGSVGIKIPLKFYAPWSIFQEEDSNAFKPASRALQGQLSLAGLNTDVDESAENTRSADIAEDSKEERSSY